MESQLTFLQAVKFFSESENCRKFMVDLRWPDGKVTCPRCGADRVTYLDKARVWKCYGKHESPKFSLKTGTIFEDSPIGLDKWLPVVWLIVNCKNGVSSYEIHRDIGVTQKTAWFMLHRVRLAMQDEETGGKLSGEVEVDETFIGGKARNMHADKRKEKIRGRGPEGKAIVAAVLERGGQVRARVISNRRKKSLHALVKGNVKPGSSLFSDALKSYIGLEKTFKHQVIDHAEAYVNGNIHTNGTENFWSLLKRGIHGTYVSVEPFHLFRYVDEQSFRFNTRLDSAGEVITDYNRFKLALSKIVGKRLTYKALIGQECETAVV